MSHYEPSWDDEGNPAVGTWVKEEPDCPPCGDTGMRNGRNCADCNPNRWQRVRWAVLWRVRRAVQRVRVRAGRGQWDEEAPF